jgi:succinate-semialdehyde dehydrogenase/glutarate-semialdehyde dehydrogenase
MARATIEAVSPVDGRSLGAVAATAPGDVAAVVAGAAEVQPLWAQLRLADRARYLLHAAQAIIDEWDELVGVLVAEGGRPIAEAQTMELLPAVETLQWIADAGPGVLGPERLGVSRTLFPAKRARTTFEPLGVVAVLTPGAEPFATPLGDVAVALMGGNGVVLHPSPLACLAGERLARVFARAGLPEGLLRVVHGGPDTGRALVAADVAQVRFTGSPAAGREVGELCAQALKRAIVETGGKDPMLVLEDANLPRTVAGALWGAFANAGQAGGSVARAYVVPGPAERFLAQTVAGARALRVGDPSRPEVEVGPLLARERVQLLAELVAEACDAGATLHCGGPTDVDGVPGACFAPAVLTGVPAGARLLAEEAPGPVLCVEVVSDEKAAIAAANAGVAGLGASVWTADRHKGARIARELDAGMVWLNDHLVSRAVPQLPWGAAHGSGVGRARGAAALRSAVEPKLVTWDPPAGRAFWWPPYDETLVSAGRTLARLRSVRDADRSRAWRTGAMPVARVATRSLRSLRRR